MAGGWIETTHYSAPNQPNHYNVTLPPGALPSSITANLSSYLPISLCKMSNHQSPIPSPPSGGWLKVAKDIVAGTTGGISVTLVGHPFDTLKVRLQTQSQAKPLYSECMSCRLLLSAAARCRCTSQPATGSVHGVVMSAAANPAEGLNF